LQLTLIGIQPAAHGRKQRIGELALQLFQKFVDGGLTRVSTHDNSLDNTTITNMQLHSRGSPIKFL